MTSRVSASRICSKEPPAGSMPSPERQDIASTPCIRPWAARCARSCPDNLGVRCDERGQVVVDDKLRTSVENVYAAGDVTSELNQIAVAAGQTAIAATAIHNSLRVNR